MQIPYRFWDNSFILLNNLLHESQYVVPTVDVICLTRALYWDPCNVIRLLLRHCSTSLSSKNL